MPTTPTTPENQKVLDAAKEWFEKKIIHAHQRNTLKLGEVNEFNVNPFTVWYLAKFIDGEVTPRSIAKALIYPRALGTSITTSFGAQLQRFITDTLVTAYGSAASGMDIEFTDHVDGLKKYSQIKAGPNTINKDDVKPINEKFTKVQNLLKANGTSLSKTHFVMGILWGEESELSNWNLQLRDKYGWELYVGKDFWLRLTGDESFMEKLVNVVRQSTNDTSASSALETAISQLAADKFVQKLAQRYSEENQV